jgi:hypothetical protein
MWPESAWLARPHTPCARNVTTLNDGLQVH